jgi:hypothetical protein
VLSRDNEDSTGTDCNAHQVSNITYKHAHACVQSFSASEPRAYAMAHAIQGIPRFARFSGPIWMATRVANGVQQSCTERSSWHEPGSISHGRTVNKLAYSCARVKYPVKQHTLKWMVHRRQARPHGSSSAVLQDCNRTTHGISIINTWIIVVQGSTEQHVG